MLDLRDVPSTRYQTAPPSFEAVIGGVDGFVSRRALDALLGIGFVHITDSSERYETCVWYSCGCMAREHALGRYAAEPCHTHVKAFGRSRRL
jgi:hypothetical protein